MCRLAHTHLSYLWLYALFIIKSALHCMHGSSFFTQFHRRSFPPSLADLPSSQRRDGHENGHGLAAGRRMALEPTGPCTLFCAVFHWLHRGSGRHRESSCSWQKTERWPSSGSRKISTPQYLQRMAYGNSRALAMVCALDIQRFHCTGWREYLRDHYLWVQVGPSTSVSHEGCGETDAILHLSVCFGSTCTRPPSLLHRSGHFRFRGQQSGWLLPAEAQPPPEAQPPAETLAVAVAPGSGSPPWRMGMGSVGSCSPWRGISPTSDGRRRLGSSGAVRPLLSQGVYQ